MGWRVSCLEQRNDDWYAPDPSVEAILVLHESCDVRRLPRNLVTVAWMADEPGRWLDRVWFDEFDIVFASSEPGVDLVRQRRAKVARLDPMMTDGPAGGGIDGERPRAVAIREALVGWASATRYGLRIGVPKWDHIDRWGDYHFARGLQRALERAGHPTRVHFLPDWASPTAARDDIAVHLLGLKAAPTNRGQVHLLWPISHPDLATPEICERSDHVFVASDRFPPPRSTPAPFAVPAPHRARGGVRWGPPPPARRGH